MFAPAYFSEGYFPKRYFPPGSAVQALHGRRRGRIIREEVLEKVPDGLIKPPPPPPPDFGETVQVDLFSSFEPSKANIVFKGLENIPSVKPKNVILEEEESEALALILSELD